MKTIARITSLLIGLILLTSCAQSIDGNLESDYIEEENDIVLYKGEPYNGEMFFNYENGQLEEKGNYKDGKPDGLFETYYENGQLTFKGNFKDGEKDGLFEEYYENGQLSVKVNFKDGKWDGLYELYYENGQLKLKQNYKDGELINNWYLGQVFNTQEYADIIVLN